ncbi:MAG: Bug family tripartite tricarboxylate transporter substrate binding protein [Lautropia sp.]
MKRQLEPTRRRLLKAAVLANVAVSVQARAQTDPFPSKPVMIISPYAAGGSTSTLARVISDRLATLWGQPVHIDNRPGANSVIGTSIAAKATPDGYSLLITLNTHVVLPSLQSLPYDAIGDFAPIATLASSEWMLVVHPSVPARDLKEFIALAKSQPRKLNYGSSGNGTIIHVVGELFNNTAGVSLGHVPYGKGGGAILTDLIGGHIQAYFAPPISVIQHVRAGRVRALAVSGNARLPALPDVPTFAQAGLPAFDVTSWFGLLAPAATPSAIIEKISRDVEKIVRTPEVEARLVDMGMAPLSKSNDEFSAMMKADLKKYAEVIKSNNIKPDN